ncbi:MAG: hypothetical protein AAF602_19855 [Myxococcota bacterium]
MIWFAMLACSGTDPVISLLLPELQVAPPVVDFEQVGLLSPETRNLIVANAGRADLTLDLSLDREEAVFLVEPPADPWVLGPRDEVLLPVTFSPDTFRRYSAQLRFDSNDPDRPTVWIPLRGEGADIPYPDIAVLPSRTIEIEDAGIEAIEVRNEGEDTLLVTDIRLEGDPAFTLATDPLDGAESWPIAPGSSSTLLIDYAPPDPEGEIADLFLESNDPDESPLQVRLVGNGGGDFDRPVAVVDCPMAIGLAGPRNVMFDGTDSFDPGGFEPLRYQWSVVQRPAGSDADIPLDPADQPLADLYVDVAGNWAIQLVVVNALDTESEPVVCAFGAAPEDKLYVELSWDSPNADIDLHLIEGTQAVLFQEPEDCNYCNTNPNWGANGPDDDPRLDIDDLAGFGPENINIFQPQQGAFQVKVHYFRRNGEEDPVNARVRVWINGIEQTYTPLTRLMEFDEIWDVGTIDMAYELWFPLSTANRDNDGPRDCFVP